MIVKFRVPFLRNVFSVQRLIYDNNASHDLGSFTVDCANGRNDKCVVRTASKRNLSFPRLYSLPMYIYRESKVKNLQRGKKKKKYAKEYNYLKEYYTNASNQVG